MTSSRPWSRDLFPIAALFLGLLVGCEGPLVNANLASPTGLHATSGDQQLVLSWSGVPGATGYHLYWSRPSEGNDAMKIADAVPPFTHANLSNGTTYRYVVTAFNAEGESLPSSPVFATPETTVQGQGNVVFSFAPPPQGAPDFYVYPEGFQPGLYQLVLSLQRTDGSPVLERTTVDLVSTSDGYQSEPLGLPAGTYQLVEAFAVNALQVTKFAVPKLNSVFAKVGPEFDQDWPGALPITIQVAENSQGAVALATRPADFRSKPADYGYTSFAAPLPEPVGVGLSLQAVDPEGNPIRSFLWKHSYTGTQGGGASTFGWGIRAGALRNNLPSVPDLRGLDFVRFQVGAFGYRDSVHFLRDSQDLYQHREANPTYTVVLEPEATLVELRQAGTTESGQPLIQARIKASQFIEETFDAAGALETDKYQFVVGFEVGTAAQGDLTPPATNPGSSLFYMGPYNSQLVQGRHDYQTLQATVVLKDAQALAQLLDVTNGPLVQLYLEIAALKGDGKTVFDADDELLVSKQQVLNVGSHQISWAP